MPTQPPAVAASCAFSDDAFNLVRRLAAPPRPRADARRRRAPLPAEAVTDPIHPDALGPHRLVTGVRSFFQAGGTITAMSRR